MVMVMGGHPGPMGRQGQIAVIGSGTCEEGSEPWRLAEEVGRRLAAAGVTVVCGGMTGVMEAVAGGAAQMLGPVIGILPGSEIDDANPHCTHIVATGIGHGRNLAVVASGEATIAIGGEWGTLSEIGFARAIGRPVVALRSWTPKGEGAMQSAPGIVVASTPEEAVAAALEAIA
ncbi:MAG TPA: TIGR00725 family protein [Solirubrobacterales bacterium]|nr:TIGR00725 family protein [Solirubrobacterales bacterium]